MEETMIHINGRVTLNFYLSLKSIIYVKKEYVWNPATSWILLNYLASIMNDLAIICDEVIEPYKYKKKKIQWKNTTCKTQNVYILLAFLLITIALLVAVSIYFYIIKYWEKRNKIIIISQHK